MKMGLNRIKKYSAVCDNCEKEEIYETELHISKKYRIPDGWDWREVKGYSWHLNEKLFCKDCLKLSRTKWDY